MGRTMKGMVSGAGPPPATASVLPGTFLPFQSSKHGQTCEKEESHELSFVTPSSSSDSCSLR